jgi:hypothetical protein
MFCVFRLGRSAGDTLAANCSAELWELSEHKLHTKRRVAVHDSLSDFGRNVLFQALFKK